MLETVIPVVGNLLGGLFGNKSAKKAAAQQRALALEDQREQFVRLRAAAEKGGFNPLAVLGANPGAGMVNPTPVSSNNYMGSAIAESSLLVADKLAQSKAASLGRTVEDLNRQKDILTRKLTQNTLRPKVPGVYGIGGANASPSFSAVRPSPSTGAITDLRGNSVVPKVTALHETLVSSGSSTDVPRGPDSDEVLIGWITDLWNREKADRRFENSNAGLAGRAQRYRPAPPAPLPKIRLRDVLRGTLPPVFWGVGS